MAFGIPNIERVVSNFLEGGTGITALRSIEWDKNFLWTIDFPDYTPPAPFDSFFPASEVSIPMGIIRDDIITFGQSEIRFPVGSQSRELSITFYDDEQRTLLRWMKDWMNLDILNNGQFLSALEDTHLTVEVDSITGKKRPVKPVRTIRLSLLEAFRKEVVSYSFGVFPTGEITYSGGQGSEATTYTMQFVIAEDLNRKAKVDSGDGGFATIAKQLIGRFV